MLTVSDLLTVGGCALALAAVLIAYWRTRQIPHLPAPVYSGITGSDNLQVHGSHNTLTVDKSNYALVKENELLRSENCHLKKQNRALVKHKTTLLDFQVDQQKRYYAQFERQQAEIERLLQRVRHLENLERQIALLPFPAKA